MARYGKFSLPGPGNLRTPLEGVDLVADGINRVASLPGQVIGGMLDAAGNAFGSVTRDLESPREQPERPIPPDVLISPVAKGLGDVVGGVIDVAKTGVDAVVQNVEGARRELEDFVRG